MYLYSQVLDIYLKEMQTFVHTKPIHVNVYSSFYAKSPNPEKPDVLQLLSGLTNCGTFIKGIPPNNEKERTTDLHKYMD